MLDALDLEHLREALGDVDGDRADQDRLPFPVALGDVVDHGLELGLLRRVDEIVHVVPDHVLVVGMETTSIL